MPKSKYPASLWSKVEKRVIADKAEIKKVSKETGIPEQTIYKHLRKHAEPIMTMAAKLRDVEEEIERLPIDKQVKVRAFADILKGISFHLGMAAEHGAKTAHQMNRIANLEAMKIDEANPEEHTDRLQMIAALSKLANEASAIGVNVLKATNIDAVRTIQKEADSPALLSKPISDDPKEALEAYMGMLNNS